MNKINENYIFISYSHKDDVKEIVRFLSNKGYNCLFDEAISIGSDWEIKARRYIGSSFCMGIVVILTKNSILSNPILRELEFAEKFKKPIFPLVMREDSVQEVFDSVDSKTLNDDQHYVKGEIRSFFSNEDVYITEKQFFDDMNFPKIENTFSEWGMTRDLSKEIVHSTYTSERENELERLRMQQKLFFDFDKKLFGEIIDKEFPNGCAVLDVGCNDGTFIMERLKGKANLSVVGIDINMEAVNRGNDKYGGDNYRSYCIDCMEEGFLPNMQEIMESRGIEGFDIVVCSMVMMHLDDPYKCLKTVRKLLKKGGYLFVRDIDDGLSISYPDPEELVNTFNDYSKKLSFTGSRHIGRELYRLLIKSGYEEVKVIPQEITTVGQDYDMRDAIFNVSFRFVLEGLSERYEKDPTIENKNDYEWGKHAFDDLEELFHTPGYFYRMGIMVFLAKK